MEVIKDINENVDNREELEKICTELKDSWKILFN